MSIMRRGDTIPSGESVKSMKSEKSASHIPAASFHTFILFILFALSAFPGCTAQKTAEEELADGQVSLGGSRYDLAVEHATASIKLKPTADAYYLRARAEEDRPKPDSDIAAADLGKARDDYRAALDFHPPQPIKSRSQAGLANVSFSLDDYDTAIFEWLSCVDDLDDPQWKASALIGVGEAQQRMCPFSVADKTFQRVVKDYPETDAATKAQLRIGVAGYFVQIGAFNNIDDAQNALKSAQAAGFSCRQVGDQGLYAVRGGPYWTYADAKKAKATIIQQFPNAIVGP